MSLKRSKTVGSKEFKSTIEGRQDTSPIYGGLLGLPTRTPRVWKTTRDGFKIPLTPDKAFGNHLADEWDGCGCACYNAISGIGVFDYLEDFAIKDMSKNRFIKISLSLGEYVCWCHAHGNTDCEHCRDMCCVRE